MQANIRKAEESDIHQIKELMKKFGGVKKEDLLDHRIRQVLESNNQHLLVAEADNNLIGYAWVQSYGKHLRSGEIIARFNDLYVLPEYRQKGIGSRLFENIKIWSKYSNVKYLQWQAGVSATKFYEKLGLRGDTKSDLQEHPFYEIEF